MPVWEVESWIGNRPGEEAFVWRYLSVAKLDYLTTTSELYLPRLDLQEDDAEGRWPVGVERLMFTGGDVEPLRQALEAIRTQTFASCWTLRRGICDRMWTEYGAEDGAAIGLRYCDLLASVADASISVAAGGVVYCDVIDRRWVDRFGRVNTLVLPFQKRSRFAWECEVRLVHQCTEDGGDLPSHIGVPIELDRLGVRVVAAPRADLETIEGCAARLGVDVVECSD